MKKILAIFTNPVVKNFMMGLTGAFLTLFMLIHLTGNALIFMGPEVFNGYTHFLHKLPILRLIELCLLVCILYHAISGIWGKIRDHRGARDRQYAIRRNAVNSRRNFASRTMHYTGAFLLIFIVIHYFQIVLPPAGELPTDRDLYSFMLEHFSDWKMAAAYEFVLLVFGTHMFHGLGTLYESFGIAHRTWMRRIGQAVAVIITLGFMTEVLCIHLFLV